MNLKERLPALFVMGVVVAGVGLFVSDLVSRWDEPSTIKVKVPDLSPLAMKGKEAFDNNCSACHGANAGGSDKGPPLVHKTYNPGHHADAAFFLAAQRGTRQHHWRFGNMPPQPQVTKADLELIVKYVRELQAANGIFYQPHNM